MLDQVWADQEEEAAMIDLNFLSLGSRGGDHIHSTMQASSSATAVKERGLPSACVFIAHLEANMSDSILYHALFKLMARNGFILDLQIHRDAKYRPFAFCQVLSSLLQSIIPNITNLYRIHLHIQILPIFIAYIYVFKYYQSLSHTSTYSNITTDPSILLST